MGDCYWAFCLPDIDDAPPIYMNIVAGSSRGSVDGAFCQLTCGGRRFFWRCGVGSSLLASSQIDVRIRYAERPTRRLYDTLASRHHGWNIGRSAHCCDYSLASRYQVWKNICPTFVKASRWRLANTLGAGEKNIIHVSMFGATATS